MDATLRIKNLSIALEALSRFHLGEHSYVFKDITSLLEDEIRTFRETKEKETQWPHKAPAKPHPEDEMPF